MILSIYNCWEWQPLKNMFSMEKTRILAKMSGFRHCIWKSPFCPAGRNRAFLPCQPWEGVIDFPSASYNSILFVTSFHFQDERTVNLALTSCQNLFQLIYVEWSGHVCWSEVSVSLVSVRAKLYSNLLDKHPFSLVWTGWILLIGSRIWFDVDAKEVHLQSDGHS